MANISATPMSLAMLRFEATLKTRKVESPYVMVVLANNSYGTLFALYRDDEGDTEKWKVRLFLEKDRGEVGRMSRVAPPVVIREELAHRSPGHLTGYHLPKEKRTGG